jgi:hypothetical protein
MSELTYSRKLGSRTVHASVSTELFAGRLHIHDRTVCGRVIEYGTWVEAPRPTASGFESDLNRCKVCDRRGGFDDPAVEPRSVADELAAIREELGWTCKHGCDDGDHAAPKADGICICCGDPVPGAVLMPLCPVTAECTYRPIDDDDLVEHTVTNHA